MKFLSVAVVVALVAFTYAVPVTRDEEDSEELTPQDITDALESIEVVEASASESQLYFLNKIKRAIKRGVRVDVGVRIRPAAANLADESLSFEEFQELLGDLEETMPSVDNYFFKKIRKGLRKVGRAVEKGVKKIFEGKGVGPINVVQIPI